MQQTARKKNLLIIEESANRKLMQNLLFEVAVKYATSNKYVIFVTEKPIDQVSRKVLHDYNNIYKMIIFIYTKSVQTALQKLNDIQQWNFTPSLVIIESIHDLLHASGDHTNYMHCLFISTVLDTVQYFSQKQHDSCQCIFSVTKDIFTTGKVSFEMYFREENVIDGQTITSCTDFLDILRECLVTQ
ncbi:uncharacterized protein LOC129778372 [Toxorhynchites rutilus septentrionalis]|uniref:uncharacterized protein LOC129778372 n=1 Tax=Toxorhynchites rutilus septentrionalis TaxID=329112 RepID=UPI00247A7050|nr:uncharacterized protein LOC129778372 [Toxorhynchites rutilus septentrionalis]